MLYCKIKDYLFIQMLAMVVSILAVPAFKSTSKAKSLLIFRYSIWSTSLVISIMLSFVSSLHAASFYGIGDLPGGAYFSQATAVSDDGLTVIGNSLTDDTGAFTRNRGFLWQIETGMVALSTSDTVINDVYGVSRNGAKIVGKSDQSAAAWTASGIDILSEFGDATLSPKFVVSSDGSRVAGTALPDRFVFGAVSVDGMLQELEKPSVEDPSFGVYGTVKPTAISSNGHVIGGYALAYDSFGRPRQRPALMSLYAPAIILATDRSGEVLSVTDDGSTAVINGAIWTTNSGVQELDWNRGSLSPMSITASGGHIVGMASVSDTSGAAANRAFWGAIGGEYLLVEELLAQQGVVNGLDQWQSSTAVDVSADGRTVVGYGVDPMGRTQGWVAILDIEIYDLFWTGGASSDFSSAANWNTLDGSISNSAPSSSTHISFQNTSSYGVTLSNSQIVDHVTVSQGAPTFDLGLAKLSVTGDFKFDGGDVTLTNGSVEVGGTYSQAASATLRLRDGGRLATGPMSDGGQSLASGELHVAAGTDFVTGGKVAVGNSAVLPTSTAVRVVVGRDGYLGLGNDATLTAVGGGVFNEGHVEIEASPNRQPLETGLNRYKSRIVGDYEQAPSGVLNLHLFASDKDADVIVGPNSTQNQQTFQLDIQGDAGLNGTLNVSRDNDFIPGVGDRFGLIQYESVAGRFHTFEGAAINNDVFFALDYQADNLDAIVLPTPRRPDGVTTIFADLPRFVSSPDQSGRGLMLIAHGTTSGPDGWALPLAQSVFNQTPNSAVSEWDILVVDWSDFDGSFASFFDQAKDTARTGSEIGESIALWLQDLNNGEGVSGYEVVHAMGHSSGAWLADGLIDRLKNQEGYEGTHRVVTFFDANNADPDHPDWAAKVDRVLGDSADWAEHFVDRRSLAGALEILFPDTTKDNLPKAFNIDVSLLDSRSEILKSPIDIATDRHGWPYDFYAATVNNTGLSGQFTDWGFDVSPYSAGGYPLHADWPQNTSVTLLPNGRFLLDTTLSTVNSGIVNVIPSDTGTVEYDASDSTINLVTGSPAIATVLIDAESAFDFISFEFAFASALASAEGLLTAYLDGEQIGQFDERLYGDAFASSGLLWTGGTLSAGMHTLTLRLDPFTDAPSSIEISNIQLLTGRLVPEPTTAGLLAVLGTAVGVRRRRVA